jgi:hypothetical protein
MVENDKENYLTALTSSGPILALAGMSQRFEAMPGNNPTRIPALSIDFFRAPYTGWYRVHFSCQAAKQEVTTTRPDNPTDGSASIIRDGFHFVLTYKRSAGSPVEGQYDQQTGQSLFNIQQPGGSPYIGNVIARASFVASGITVPAQAFGYVWLNRGDSVGWHTYVYVANNNYDSYGTDTRYYGRVILNDASPSDTRMGYGSPRLYNVGTTPGVDRTAGTSIESTPTNAKATISAIATPNDNPLRKSYLMVQFVGTGGIPDIRYQQNLESQLNARDEPDALNNIGEVY